jgi:5-methylthioadenosine/S-adenosylhomocysteine deaminase
MTAPCDILIENGLVVTVDDRRRVWSDGAIAVKDGVIVAIGPSAEVAPHWTPTKRIDAQGGVVHPGFIDGHYHAGLHLIRGALSDDPNVPAVALPGKPGPFGRWLNALTEKDEHAATRLMACELAMNGFTGFVEAATAFFPDVVADAASEVGIRSSVSDCMLWDLTGGEPMAVQVPRAPCDHDRAMAGLGGQLWRNAKGGLSRGHVGIYGAGSASDELMAEARRVADADGSVVHQHQSFMAEDAAADAARFGKPALVHFAEKGLIGPSSVFTHMNALTEAEAEAVVASGMALVWHPGNTVYYGISPSSPSRFPAMARAGTSVAFGTDVAKAWSFGDLGIIGYLLAREWGDYVPAETILEMFTLGGARAMGMAGKLGQLAVGLPADIVIRSASLPEGQPGFDPVRHLMLIQRTKGVETVICDGRVIVAGGRPVGVDLGEVIAEARASALRTAQAADLAPAPRWRARS